MKTPPRKFVVEFKSGRRGSAIRPDTSIWGKTDFKALIRAAEDDAPHLFEPPVAIKASADESNPEPSSAPDTNSQGNPETGNDREAERALVEQQEDILSPEGNGVTATSVVPPRLKGAKRRPRVVPNRQLEMDAGINDENAGEAPGSTGASSGLGAMSLDELATLEGENRRLKALLAEQLHRQNRWFQEKLKRFE